MIAIAGYYAEQNLVGFANWFELQAKEELDHAMLFRKYLLNQVSPVFLTEINAPNVKCTDPGECLTTELAYEQLMKRVDTPATLIL